MAARTSCCRTWRPIRRATRRPINLRSWRWSKPRPSSRAKCCTRAEASLRRRCRAAQRPRCSPSSSAISRRCGTSSRRRAVPIPPSSICSRPASAGKHVADSYAGASRPQTVVAIQYLRAIAAGLIAFQHAMGIPAFVHYAAHFGTVGVDLFFVISGFIMWTTTEGSEHAPVHFCLAGILRVVPLYWIFTTIYVAAALLTPEGFYVVHLQAAHIIKSYLFVPATHPNLGLIAPVYTLGWTLNYEMFFYLLFGLCLFVRWPRARFALLAGAFLLLVAGGLLTQPEGAIA